MSNSLAKRHEMVGDLFQLPSTRAEWDALRLTDEQVASYHELGYLAGIRILNDDQVNVLRKELDEFFVPGHDGSDLWYEYHTNESTSPEKVLFHALGAWQIRPGFHDLLWAPPLTMAASQLLGGAIRFWHDQLFCKPARHGGVVAWHQDYSYWTRTKPMAHLTAWIGLDDSTKENGCLQYVATSHLWDLLPITGLAGNMDAIREVLSDEQWQKFSRPTAIELKQGECSFHHPLLVHGSYENRTDRPRRAAVVNLFRDGTLSDSDQPLLQGVPAIPKGQPMSGDYFPFLLDPDDLPLRSRG